MNNLFENPVEYCSSAHVFVNSEELYPLTTTSKTGQFPQQKDASFNEQNSIIGFACSFRVMSVDRPNSSSRLSESILQPSCIGKDPLLAPELFENVVEYSSLTKVYMKYGQLQSLLTGRHQVFYFGKNMPPSENHTCETAAASQGIFLNSNYSQHNLVEYSLIPTAC